MTRRTLTTSEAAWLCGQDPRSFARWARDRGLEPERRQRIGRSTVTVWSIRRLLDATRSIANAA
ncbi:MAG TPA: hypothetical protein VFR23_17855 [Jiangellaceae bacterium]|nr:hypothetical protein [Jiangellaceae bacterium]